MVADVHVTSFKFSSQLSTFIQNIWNTECHHCINTLSVNGIPGGLINIINKSIQPAISGWMLFTLLSKNNQSSQLYVNEFLKSFSKAHTVN
jgi:hypothetical protein